MKYLFPTLLRYIPIRPAPVSLSRVGTVTKETRLTTVTRVSRLETWVYHLRTVEPCFSRDYTDSSVRGRSCPRERADHDAGTVKYYM